MTGEERSVAKKVDVVEKKVDNLQEASDLVAVTRRRHRRIHRNTSRPRWLVVALLVMILVGTFSFFTALRLTQVDINTRAISEKCQLGNEQVTSINAKLNQLNLLIEAAIGSGSRPPSPEVLEAFAKLRAPIPLKSCD